MICEGSVDIDSLCETSVVQYYVIDFFCQASIEHRCHLFATLKELKNQESEYLGILKTVLVRTFFHVFRRNATHCISPYAIVMCVCVCVSVCVCVYAAFVDLRKTV